MTRPPRQDEAEAAAIVAGVLNASTRWVGAHNGHDFNLYFADGSHDALEVTRITDQRWRELHAGLEKFELRVHPKGRLANTWAVWLTNDAKADPRSVRRVHERIVDLLVPIEAQGIERVDRNLDHDWAVDGFRSPSVGRLFLELPVDHAWRLPSAEPLVFVHPPGSAAYLGGPVLHDAVVAFLSEPDRRKDVLKLARAGDARRHHLFVWLEEIGDAFGPAASMFAKPPAVAPQLPAPISDIWAACRRDRVLAVWRSMPPEHWMVVTPS